MKITNFTNSHPCGQNHYNQLATAKGGPNTIENVPLLVPSLANVVGPQGVAPIPNEDGVFDLSNKGNDIVYTAPGVGTTNFDFLLLQQEGDPLYDANWPWLHASQDRKSGGVVKLSDNLVFERQTGGADGFGKPYFCVTCERAFDREPLIKNPFKKNK